MERDELEPHDVMLNVEDYDSEDDAGEGQVEAVPNVDVIKFPGSILWSLYFTVDRKKKTMTCNLCSESFSFKKSASTTRGNKHLNTKQHRKYVLANMPGGTKMDYWTAER